MQNHGGVYRSDDGGVTWDSIEKGLPANFGFPVVVHPRDPDTVYLFPLERQRRALPGRRGSAGSGAARTPATPGRPSTRACPRTSTSA